MLSRNLLEDYLDFLIIYRHVSTMQRKKSEKKYIWPYLKNAGFAYYENKLFLQF